MFLLRLVSGGLCLLMILPPINAATASGNRGIVATGHPLATEAGLNALRAGGNAIDAAVAAALTLGIVDAHNSGIGGGCFILIRLASGEYIAIDGRETAPAAAHRDMFVRDGKADTNLSQTGALASGTPGALAAYREAMQYAKQELKTHLLAAAAIAANGFLIDRKFAGRLRETGNELARFEASRVIFLQPDGRPISEGGALVQTDLAKTYRAIAENGTEWFYKGPFAEMTGAWMAENGGLLTRTDFHEYRCRFRTPLRTSYRGCEIIGFPPPSSGGVHVLQILNILENFPLRDYPHNSSDMIQLVTEAMKLAFVDRAHWLGDPEFANVPRGLVSKEYAEQLASTICTSQIAKVTGPGVPPGSSETFFEKHTTHFSTADADGNWVACTATLNTSFGSKVVVPGTGVLLNNQMDDFSIQPGIPNAFGLVGGDANAVAPGKRPLSSMSPTIVEKNGQPLAALGGAGGPTIISQTLLALIGVIDFDLPLDAALSAARFHHQWVPDELRIERDIPAEVREELRKRGYTLDETSSIGISQAVGATQGEARFIGVSDPRGGGDAAGW